MPKYMSRGFQVYKDLITKEDSVEVASALSHHSLSVLHTQSVEVGISD